MNNRLYMDVHILQTVPPSCINRDDTGSPKTAVYGGCMRSRVSSQAWKRSVRIMFRDLLAGEQVGIRTLRVPDELKEVIKGLDPSSNAEKLANEALKLAGIKTKEKNGKVLTDALFFISRKQLEALARLSVEGSKDGKAYKSAVSDNPSIDIALFGRMVASDPTLNTDAAAQVAHSISTHVVNNEYDYFTAVDDCMPEDNAGAGHLGSVEYNSSTLYRYATVCIPELYKNLGNDTARAARAFAEAFILSMPTGKQNTFANRTLPSLVYLTLRKDQPVNLVGAFEKPVPDSEQGYVNESAKRLIEYAEKTYRTFADKPETAYGVGELERLESIADVMPLSSMLDRLQEDISRMTSEEVM